MQNLVRRGLPVDSGPFGGKGECLTAFARVVAKSPGWVAIQAPEVLEGWTARAHDRKLARLGEQVLKALQPAGESKPNLLNLSTRKVGAAAAAVLVRESSRERAGNMVELVHKLDAANGRSMFQCLSRVIRWNWSAKCGPPTVKVDSTEGSLPLSDEIELVSDGDGLAVIGEKSAVERFLTERGCSLLR